MPRHARSFTHRKRHGGNPAVRVGRPQTTAPKVKPLKEAEVCALLWGDSYWPIIETVLARDPELLQLLQKCTHNNRSSHAPFGTHETASEYFTRHKLKLCNVVQLLTSLGHQQHASNDPWKIMKTIAAMKQKMKRVQFKADVHQGILLDMKVAKRKLAALQLAKPKSGTNVSEHIAMNCSDQLMLWRGCTKRRHQRQAFERTDSEGNKVLVEKNTILMMANHVIDADLFPMNDEEAEDVKQNGPWVKHPSEVLNYLDWDICQEHLYDTMESLTSILTGEFGDDEDDYAPCPSDMLYLLIRPDYNEGRTERDILRPIPDCDTNNLKDMNNYGVNLLAMHPDVAALIVHQDAQGKIIFFSNHIAY